MTCVRYSSGCKIFQIVLSDVVAIRNKNVSYVNPAPPPHPHPTKRGNSLPDKGFPFSTPVRNLDRSLNLRGLNSHLFSFGSPLASRALSYWCLLLSSINSAQIPRVSETPGVIGSVLGRAIIRCLSQYYLNDMALRPPPPLLLWSNLLLAQMRMGAAVRRSTEAKDQQMCIQLGLGGCCCCWGCNCTADKSGCDCLPSDKQVEI